MSNALRLILSFIVAALAAIVAAPEFVEFPSAVRIVLAALIAGFAAVGIVPPRSPGR